MKKLICVLLMFVMLMGLGVGASAAMDPDDLSTWPVLVLDEPADFEWINEGEDLNGNKGGYICCYRFTPVDSGSYVFEAFSPSDEPFFAPYLALGYFNGEERLTIESSRIVVFLEGGYECFITGAILNPRQPGNVFQVMVRKQTSTKWWQSLPSFLQLLLRWFAFGWIWME